MITNSLYTNPYSKYSRDTLTKQVTYTKASVPKENRDIFVKQPVSNISFTGFFFNKGLFRKSTPAKEVQQVVLTEAEKAAQLVKEAAELMSKKIKEFNGDPDLVIRDYIYFAPYTKENASEFVKYLYSHKINYDREFPIERAKNRCVTHRSLKFAMDDSDSSYVAHLKLKQKYSSSYYCCLYLFPQEFPYLKQVYNNAIKSGDIYSDKFIYNSYHQHMYRNALKQENAPLLEFLTEDLKILPDRLVIHELLKGRKHKNPEIRKYFDNKHLYNLFLNTHGENVIRAEYSPSEWSLFQDLINACGEEDAASFLKYILDNKKGVYEKNVVLDNINRQIGYLNSGERKEPYYKALSRFPISPMERQELYQEHSKNLKKITETNTARADNVIKRNVKNGIFTIQALKNCLNDNQMSPELLIQKVNETSIMDEISKIPVDESNRSEMKALVQQIRDMKYLKHQGSALSDAAYNAAQNNNADLLQLLKENYVDLSKASKEFKNSANITDEVNAILSDVKSQKVEIFDFLNDDSMLRFRSFAKTKLNTIDINSRDDKGSTLLLEAVKKGKVDLLHELENIPDVNWNITDSTGKNVLMHAIDYYYKYRNFKYAEEIIDILKNISSDKFDINYINHCANEICPFPHTAFQYAISHNNLDVKLLKKLLEISKLDVNLHAENSLPTAYIPCIKYKPSLLQFLIENTNIDTLAPYEGETLRKHLFAHKLFPDIDSIQKAAPLERLLDQKVNNNFKNKMKEIYERNGSFTIEQINDFLNYGQIENIKDEPLNSIGERIPHFIAEIFPDIENYEEIAEIDKLFKKLKEKNVNLDILDEIGRSPLRKAVELENPIMAKFFKDYGVTPFDIEEIKLLCKESDNSEIRKLFE